MLIDDRSSAVSLPELPLLGVLPGTGGLTRLVDKRHVRRDLADYVCTRPEGVTGRKAVSWRLVDEAVPRAQWADTVTERARELAAKSDRPADAAGVGLGPLTKTRTDTSIEYTWVSASLDHPAGVAAITVRGPDRDAPAGLAEMSAQGASFWTLAMTRELDDLILDLRTNEPALGTWLLRTRGDAGRVLGHDELLTGSPHWLAREIRLYLARTLKRLDVTSRSLIALIEPGSCFAGSLLELALAADRSYQLDGVFEDEDPDADPAAVVVTGMNLGQLPMGNGLSRLESRFYGDPAALERAKDRAGEPLPGTVAAELGLVTFAPDDIDWADEIRLAVEERASFSPDALTGMEANIRFAGPESMETKIFGRLTAWQNWIFNRPNAAGPEGALRRFGTGQRADFDRKRV